MFCAEDRRLKTKVRTLTVAIHAPCRACPEVPRGAQVPKFGIYGVFSIESMALGRTVICSLTDSLYENYDMPIISINPSDLASKINELYNNRKFLVEQGNAEDIIQRLSELLEDTEFATKMGKEGAKFVKQEFNWEKVTKNFLDIIKPYLNQK